MQSQYFNCPLCKSKFDRKDQTPKLISTCGHTFCSACLKDNLKKKNTFCPLDKKGYDRSLKTVEDFPTNVLVLQLLEEEINNNSKKEDKEKNQWGHTNLRYDYMGMKKNLETRLAEFDKNYQFIENKLMELRKFMISQIHASFSNAIATLQRALAELENELNQFCDKEKNRLSLKFRDDLYLKKEIEEKITLFLDPIKNNDFLESFNENDIKAFQTLNEGKMLADFVKEMKSKFQNNLESFEDSVLKISEQLKSNILSNELTKLTPTSAPNLLFYLNKIKCQPSNLFLEDIHEKW